MSAMQPSVLTSDWVPIGRACAMLGVNAATLRQWTKDGKVRVYRTPGGHRRFSAAELEAMRATDAATTPEPVTDAVIADLRAKYRGLTHSPATHQGWLAGIEGEARLQFHGLGDELLSALGTYLSTGAAAVRRRALARAREIGSQYGRLARGCGASATDAVEAYLLFRRPILDVLARTLATHRYPAEQLSPVMRDAERCMDAVLVGITEASATASVSAEAV